MLLSGTSHGDDSQAPIGLHPAFPTRPTSVVLGTLIKELRPVSREA